MAPPSAKQVADTYASLFPEVYLRFHRRDQKRSELSGASRGVLLHLAQSGPLTIGECAKHLGRTQSVVSEIVEQLIRHGWLAKVRDAADRRRSVVWLTAAGRERLIEDQEVLSRKTLERAIHRMTLEQRTMLLAGTEALLRSVHDVTPATPKPRSKRDEST
jgi:DNA-binding MarR family transcriptional regulator